MNIKKAKGVNKNVVGTITHNEYNYILLKNKCMRHSMNRIHSKDYRIGTYEINKISVLTKYISKTKYMISSWLLELIVILITI